MEAELHRNVDFSLIRYANCWEDADVLLAAIGKAPGRDLLCIASAGDNALALLSTAPQSVHAIDLSLVQLHLTELKAAAFFLEYEELLALLGVTQAGGPQRLQWYGHIRQRLSAGARAYWDDHRQLLVKGVLNAGRFENYFALFRRYFLPLAHGKKDVAQLLAPKDDKAQASYYAQHWNNRRWQWLMAIFFSRFALGRGRDPAFLKHVKLSVPQYIRLRAAAHLQSALCTQNYFLRFILTGRFDAALPFYLRPENFMVIRQHLPKLSLSCTAATEAVKEKQYHAYCLSNIFEYLSKEDFESLAAAWTDFIPKGAVLAYWNLMAPRSLAENEPQHFKAEERSQSLSATDKGFFYSRFLAETRL